jgi:hypothetical protein
MRAFHGNPAIKEKYLARVRAHRAADELIRGTGWDGHRGCAVGCTLERYDHNAYPDELGIPVELAYLEDKIFENLPENHLAWPEEFLSAIEPGADLSMVWPQFAVWLLGATRQHCDEASKAATDTVVALYLRRIGGDEPTQKEWAAASDAARAAAWAAWAASDAARAAAWAASDAARAAAGATASDAAMAAAWTRQREKLLELLRGAPCP